MALANQAPWHAFTAIAYSHAGVHTVHYMIAHKMAGKIGVLPTTAIESLQQHS